MIRTYSELITLPTFEERYKYLRIGGKIGESTFGFDRYLYEGFLKSKEWLRLRDEVIIRDNGCDLGMEDREIKGLSQIYVHHMNPISKEDFLIRSEYLLNPEYLICCTYNTHLAIHYGDEGLLIKNPIKRSKNDTCPWKK